MDTKRLYNCIADDYDKLFQDVLSKAQDKYIMGFIKNNKLDKGRILDVGCGTGLLLEYMDIDPKNYVGVDISDRMCSIARKKFPKHEFVDKNFLDYNVDDNKKFDNIISIFGALTYIEDPDALINQLKTLLKDNGNIFLMIYNADNHKPLFEKDVNISHYKWDSKIAKRYFKDFKCEIVGFDTVNKDIIPEIAEEYYKFEYNVLGRAMPDNCRYLIIKGAKKDG